MQIKTKRIKISTNKQFELVDITSEVKAFLKETNVKNGQALIYAPHTTAAVRLNHNEPLLLQDIMKMLYRISPVDINYAHDVFEIRESVAPGERSNGHAHVKSFLLGSSQTIPIENSEMTLGEKQSIFFVELDGARERGCIIQITGE